MIAPTLLADRVSTAEVAAAIAWDLFSSWRRHALVGLLERDACTIGAAELTKLIVHRTRPDGSDQKSFFSEHTALSSVSSFPRGAAFGITVTVNVASLRVIARKHWPSDTVVGAGVGLACAQLDRSSKTARP